MGGVTENYTYGDNNQLLSAGSKSYAYDLNGNLTSVTSGGQTTTLTWDFNDKVTRIDYPSGAFNTFVTSDLGMRVNKTDSAGSQDYHYDGSTVVADGRAVYTHGGVTGLISENAGGVSRAYHADHLGSTRGMTDGTQTVTDSRERDAFGLTIATSGTTATPFGFVGGQGYQSDNDSGLMLLGARYYDPSVGRFISRDPIGYEGGLNLYAYCDGDPVNRVDPSGHTWWLRVLPIVIAYFRAAGRWVARQIASARAAKGLDGRPQLPEPNTRNPAPPPAEVGPAPPLREPLPFERGGRQQPLPPYEGPGGIGDWPTRYPNPPMGIPPGRFPQ